MAWPLGFVVLVPWLLALDRLRSVRATLLAAVAMSMAFVAAVLGWFAPAISAYTGLHPALAMGLLLVLAPLLQPQFLVHALVRHAAGRRHGAALRALLATAAWLATEWAVPRVFGDTLGHGLHGSAWLRQGADLAGAAGLTLVLLVVNEALAAMVFRARAGLRTWRAPLAVALALPALLAGYGAWRLAVLERHAATPGTPLRIGLVQAGIVDYERLRREIGTYGVVRRVLDAHFAMSLRARGSHGVDALVWSETVYPTTFGQPRSEDGAAFDRELRGFARQLGLPLVFGTYERDAEGEYNVAAFVDPLDGLLGAYRKTRLFPLTEYVPPAVDTPALRRALPWAGTWRPGDGARVFPLRTLDGREVPVLPLICRDDVDPRLALDGARLGAQLILGLSNDAWFTRAPQGARLHLVVAAFRSIETRLPQLRATTNGMSAVIDAGGAILASTRMGGREVLVGDVEAREPPRTPVVTLGPWLGPLAMLVLVGGAVLPGLRALRPRAGAATPSPAMAEAPLPASALLLSSWQRALLALLRGMSRLGVLALAGVAVFGDEAARGMLVQLRQFAVLVLAPEAAAWLLAWLLSARVDVDGDRLRIDARGRRIEIPLRSLVAVRAWRLPLPSSGVDLHLAAGGRWPQGLALRGPDALADRLQQAGAALRSRPAPGTRRAWRDRALALPSRPRLDHPLPKFLLFPLLPALPAFRLHQHIAYGGTFGEWQSFGAGAWFGALGLWWASWAVALVLLAGGLRLAVELASAAVLAWRPERVLQARGALLSMARLVYYVGVPGWLLARLLGG